MLNAEAFAKMQRKPYIINCARGELVDEAALVDALKAGKISGAGLDVLESMPPVKQDNPLLKFDNVLLTPHSGWVSANSLGELQRLAALEAARVLKGGVVKSLLNPDYAKNKK
jgi:phosphoglycerate dehydrogenase-like enzyme